MSPDPDDVDGGGGGWQDGLRSVLDGRAAVGARGRPVKALGLLDRFGALRLGPESIGFDDEDVDWAKVVRIHTRRTRGVEVADGS
jgi:hypothetical protein